MSRRGATVAAALALSVLLGGAAAADEPCKIVVNPANPGLQIQRAALVAIYMGQMTRWSDGRAVSPVDQSTRAPVRAAFSEKVLKKSLMSIQAFWLRKIASEHATPPPVKSSDAEVVAYVRANAGGIGYVADDFAVDQTVKVIKVVD
jgi:ABC-type phosphate transport system substrate-binding protein